MSGRKELFIYFSKSPLKVQEPRLMNKLGSFASGIQVASSTPFHYFHLISQVVSLVAMFLLLSLSCQLVLLSAMNASTSNILTFTFIYSTSYLVVVQLFQLSFTPNKLRCSIFIFCKYSNEPYFLFSHCK